MTRWFDSLLARLLIAQVAVLALAFVAMIFTVGQQRGSAVARIVAPIWAQSIESGHLAQSGTRPPVPATMRAATPPLDARSVRALRYRVLRQELIALGVRVGDVRAQRTAAGETTWVEVLDRSANERWYGFAGGMIGLDEPTQQPMLFAIVAMLIVAVSALLTWTLVRPLARLRNAIADFRANGALPDNAHESIGGPHEIRMLAASFAEMASAKSALDRDRALMLAGISHDLRSPLARIRLTADLMNATSRETEEAKAAIKRNVDLADRHLAMFLEFSAPVLAEEKRTVDASSLWRDAIELSMPSAADVQLTIAPNATTIQSHERVLLRILSMGLENANKHGVAPIYARSFVRGNQSVFEIEDCGVALPASERARVMRPFERGESARTTPGTGLGLALASQLAARIDGRIELDEGDHGFVFRMIVERR
jgi:two-component system, OmpR family, osmolarity sensor histidine kinase EnvZ